MPASLWTNSTAMLERLARSCARPPLALRRLSLTQDGQILYRVKHAAPGAPRLLRLTPTQFLGRLSALFPPPRSHLVRFFGVFGPHSKHRQRIEPKDPARAALPQQQDVSLAPASTGPGPKLPQYCGTLPSPKPLRGPYRLPWATLLRRVFATDVWLCDRCGGRRRLVALIQTPKVAEKILAHLGLPTHAPARWLPARRRKTLSSWVFSPTTASTRSRKAGTTDPASKRRHFCSPVGGFPPLVYVPLFLSQETWLFSLHKVT